MTRKKVKKGLYHNDKGENYEVLDEALNSENKKELVIYQEVKDGKKDLEGKKLAVKNGTAGATYVEENLKGKIENRLGKKERTNYCSTVSKKVTTVQPERRTQDVLLSSTNERTLYKVCKCVTLQIDLALSLIHI